MRKVDASSVGIARGLGQQRRHINTGVQSRSTGFLTVTSARAVAMWDVVGDKRFVIRRSHEQKKGGESLPCVFSARIGQTAGGSRGFVREVAIKIPMPRSTTAPTRIQVGGTFS